MTQNDFMMDFFGNDRTVTVNAVELQNTLKRVDRLERENKQLKSSIETLKRIIETERERDKKASVYVKLDIKG